MSAMSATLAEMTAGFRDATHGAQQTFRAVLDAMSRPGHLFALPPAAIAGIVPPASARVGEPMSAGMAAVLLTLLDGEVAVRLAGSLMSAAAASYVRFHTGVHLASTDELAEFTAVRADDVDAPLWQGLDLGSDEAPQRGATLIVEVDAFADRAHTRLRLSGPGIQTTQALGVTGLSAEFWSWRMRAVALMPRGVDLILVCGTQLAALPRSTRIELEA
jgi:alpha-D-ribose 1-methylphosphonate 5-triphosphate synthase subunit PhnH